VRHEEADPAGDHERDEAAGQHDAMDLGIRGRDRRQRQGHSDDADRAAAVDDGQRHVEERHADRRAGPAMPPDPAG
jgi:hypothetical protein